MAMVELIRTDAEDEQNSWESYNVVIIVPDYETTIYLEMVKTFITQRVVRGHTTRKSPIYATTPLMAS
jgi:hypothetical protein